MYMLIHIPAQGTNGTRGHLNVVGLLWVFMKIKETKIMKAMTENTMVTGRGKLFWNEKADMKLETTNAMMSEIGRPEYFPPLYLNIITPAQMRLKAIKVPIEIASARMSRVIKNAITAVKIPVMIVPNTGTSLRLVVVWKKVGSNPCKENTSKRISWNNKIIFNDNGVEN